METRPPRHRHIRFRGEEVRKGKRILGQGTVIHPGVVGILAAVGKSVVPVVRKPRVALAVTGDELLRPGARIKRGKFFDSNTSTISTALSAMNIQPRMVRLVRDDKARLRQVLKSLLKRTDVLILTGGVSVGEFDYVKDVLRNLGVRAIFWQVNQKPGKPLFFGRRKNALVFGLPGNPGSVIHCFYEYVFPALRRRMGFKKPFLEQARVRLTRGCQRDPKKTLFLKAVISLNGQGHWADPVRRQGSNMVFPFRQANSFIRVPAGKRKLKAGDEVFADILPFAGGVFR